MLCFTLLLLIQVFSAFAAPVANSSVEEMDKRSYIPPGLIPFNVYFEKPSYWGNEVYAYVYTSVEHENGKEYLKEWPGELLKKYEKIENAYIFTTYRQYFGGNLSHIIFSDGKNQVPGVYQEGFPLVRNAYYTEKGITAICPQYVEYSNTSRQCGNYVPLYYKLKQEWRFRDVYAHYKIGNGEWTKTPQLMLNHDRVQEFIYYVDVGNDNEVTVAFTNGTIWDNNHGQDFKVYALSDVLIENTV